MLTFTFFLYSIAFGVGLAMDAFSVSFANGLSEPGMRKRRMCGIAGIFAFFQALMPMIGWICIHTVVRYFKSFEKFIPWIALILLGYIGGKMLFEGIKQKDACSALPTVGFGGLLVQGVATSIDALSVGFTIADYIWWKALICAGIIAVVTFIICMIGLQLGRKIGKCLSGKASIFGGVILILIGLEIFITSFF
jgi:putative Mn2+ efflux pump MntP